VYVFYSLFLWFLYWIGYDVAVWNKPYVEVNLFNYAAAILSLSLIFMGYRLREVKNIMSIFKKEEIEEQGTVQEPIKTEEDPLLFLQRLKNEENSLMEKKQDLLTQKEKQELEIREEIEATTQRIEELKNEISELAHQCEKLGIS
jgi:predicted nuclease with TOPRIM domain